MTTITINDDSFVARTLSELVRWSWEEPVEVRLHLTDAEKIEGWLLNVDFTDERGPVCAIHTENAERPCAVEVSQVSWVEVLSHDTKGFPA